MLSFSLTHTHIYTRSNKYSLSSIPVSITQYPHLGGQQKNLGLRVWLIEKRQFEEMTFSVPWDKMYILFRNTMIFKKKDHFS